MSTTTDPGADMLGNANGGDTSNASTSDIDARLDAKLNKIMSSWIKRLEAKIPQLVESKIEAMVQSEPEADFNRGTKPQPAPKNVEDGDGNRLSLKALESTISELKQQLLKRDDEVKQERERTRETEMRSRAREALAEVFGADNPNLGFLMDSLHVANKRFLLGDDGQPLMRFKADFGEDDVLPLKEGVKRLAETECKHLIPSKKKVDDLPIVRGRVMAPTNGAKPNNTLDSIFSTAAAAAFRAVPDPTQK